MHAMAKALLEWETIDGDQVEDIMNGKPPRPPKDWTPAPSSAGGTMPPVDPGRRARRGLRLDVPVPRRGFGPVSALRDDAHSMFWQTHAASDRPRRARG